MKHDKISNPAPLTMYNSFGAPGHNTGYAFSSVDNSFGKENGHSRNFSGERLTSIV